MVDEELIKKSLEDKQFTDSIFFDLPLITQLELKKLLFKSFDGQCFWGRKFCGSN